MARRPLLRINLEPPASVSADERLLTVKEAAAFLRVRPGTVYTWVECGRLDCLRAGNRIRFRLVDLVAWAGGRAEGRF